VTFKPLLVIVTPSLLVPPDSEGAGREILPLMVTVSPLTVNGLNVPLAVLSWNVSA